MYGTFDLAALVARRDLSLEGPNVVSAHAHSPLSFPAALSRAAAVSRIIMRVQAETERPASAAANTTAACSASLSRTRNVKRRLSPRMPLDNSICATAPA